MKHRSVQPELLETLPDDHPDAIKGRQDLLLVNWVMGNHRWMIRTLRRHIEPGWRITEIGAGDGSLSRRLLKEGLCQPEDLHGFDLAVRQVNWPKRAQWIQGDLFEHALPASEVLIANLILHHFTDAQLRRLASRIPQQTRLILASEPARHWSPSFFGRLLCSAARFHPITRHDMQISIRAGFRGSELVEALDLGSDWSCTHSASLAGAYHMIAVRRA